MSTAMPVDDDFGDSAALAHGQALRDSTEPRGVVGIEV